MQTADPADSLLILPCAYAADKRQPAGKIANCFAVIRIILLIAETVPPGGFLSLLLQIPGQHIQVCDHRIMTGCTPGIFPSFLPGSKAAIPPGWMHSAPPRPSAHHTIPYRLRPEPISPAISPWISCISSNVSAFGSARYSLVTVYHTTYLPSSSLHRESCSI